VEIELRVSRRIALAKRIHQYRPQRSSLEGLEFIFVARENLLFKILDHLRKWEAGASRQHYLLIGPRGIGKTHVINLIDHRISKDQDLRRKWESLVFPEEAYGITRVSDLLVTALKILTERVSDSEIRNAYESVRYDDDHQRVTDRALDAFRKFHQSSGRSLLVMLENVNRLFERQIKDKKEIHLFRKILIEEDWLLTVCTSPTYLNAVSDAEEPLFEFFQIEFLSELTFNEQYELLQKLAAYENNDRFKEYLEQYRSRLRALYHFSGGNPRLTIMLYELISYHSIVDVQDELEGLIDQITPFYQDRMKDIGELEGKLMEAMSLMPEGCSPSELALETRMPAKTVRALLTRLQKAGYVRPEQRRKKKTVYIIPERLFRIWHQMNHSRYVRGLIQYLLEFFSTWYETRNERDIVWDELTEKLKQRTEMADEERADELNQYLDYLVAVSEGVERFEREFDRLSRIEPTQDLDSIILALEAIDMKYGEDGLYYIYKGNFIARHLNDYPSALEAFGLAAKLRPYDVIPLYNQTVIHKILANHDIAKEVYTRAARLLTQNRDSTVKADTSVSLLEILESDSYPPGVQIAAFLLQNIMSEDILSDILRILQKAKESFRKLSCLAALCTPKATKAVPVILNFLKAKSTIVRGSAATALGRIGSEAAVATLLEILHDEASNVRGSAAAALGRIGSEAAVAVLLESLRDEASNVRGSAATALGLIRSEAAVAALLESLHDEASSVRGSAATALGLIRSEAAVAALLKILHDEDSRVRGSVATALGRIGSVTSIKPLIRLLQDQSRGVRGAVIVALSRIDIQEPILPIEEVLIGVSDILRKETSNTTNIIIRNFLRSAFSAQNQKRVREIITSAKAYLDLPGQFYLPYDIALEYLESEEAPIILERQQPEMREAVLMLVELYERGQINSEEFD